MFFDDNDFVVIVVVVAVVVNFECVDFAALATGIDLAAVHVSFVDSVPAVAEIIWCSWCIYEIVGPFFVANKESNTVDWF